MINIRRHITLLAIIMLSIQSLYSQQVWDLEKCIQRALDYNLTIKQSSAAIKFQEIDISQSKHDRYPNLNAGSDINWNFGRSLDPVTNDFDTETFFSNRISLSSNVTLYNGGLLKNSLKQSKLGYQSALLNLNQAQKDISLNVALTFLNVLFAEENLKIVENQLTLSQEQLKQIDRLIEVGIRPENERLNLLAEVSRNEQSLISSKNNVATQMLSLIQMLRLDVEEDIVLKRPESQISTISDPDVLNFNEVFKKALESQSNIKAGEIDIEYAILGEKIARAGLLPRLSAGINIGTNYSNKGLRIIGTEDVIVEQDIIFQGTQSTIGFPQSRAIIDNNPYFNQLDENLSYGAGFSLSIPIYNNNINRNNISRARLNIENEQIENELRIDQLKTEVQQSLANARSAKKQYAASQKTVEALESAFKNAKQRFKLGSINTFEFIDTKNQMDIAQLNLIIAKYDYLFKSKVIDYYMGYPLQLN